MWYSYTDYTELWNEAKVIEPDLDNQESLDCICRAFEAKSGIGYTYSGSGYDIVMLIFENDTFGHKVVKIATSGTYDTDEVCNIILDMIRYVMDEDGTTHFHIRMQPWVDLNIVAWFKDINNVWEYCSEDEIIISNDESVQCYHRE